MKTLGKLLIPLGLGVLAFVFNWMAVQPQLGRNFVSVRDDVPLDKPLTASQLVPFKVVGDDFAHLKKTFVPWEERTAVVGLPVRREMKGGDLVFWQDVRYPSADFLHEADEIPLHISLEGVDYEPSLLKVGNQIGLVIQAEAERKDPSAVESANVPDELKAKFDVIGPFRVLSVGERTLESPGDNNDDTKKGNTHIVTLAVKTDEKDSTKPTVTGADGKPIESAAATTTDTAVQRRLPEAAGKLLAVKTARHTDGKSIVALVLYQDVDKLRRMRELQGELDEKSAKPAASPSASGS